MAWGKEFGELLTLLCNVYRKMIAVKLTFVRFGGGKEKKLGGKGAAAPWLLHGYVLYTSASSGQSVSLFVLKLNIKRSCTPTPRHRIIGGS